MPDRPAIQRPAMRSIVAGLLVAIVATGCGGGALGALQGLASLDPAPTAAPPRPSAAIASSGPAAEAAKHEAAIEAFADRVASGDLSYRVAFKGRTALSVTVLTTSGRMDVEGEDFASSATYEFTGSESALGEFRIQVRAVKGKAYAKIADSKWVTVTGYRDADTHIPFHAVETARDVQYLGTEERKGKTVHRISIPEAHLIDPTSLPLVISNERIRRTTLELLIDDAGKPIAGTWELDGQARVGDSGQLQQLLIELDLTFAKVGSDFSITKP